MKRISFDRVADEYDETRGLPDDAMDNVIDALCEQMSEGESVLDVGSGTGRFALPLTMKGFFVTGVDISKRMIEISRKKGFNCCIRGDASFLPFKSGSFDFALANHVLHLLEDWRDTLSEIGRVVKDSMIVVSLRKKNGWFKNGYDDLLKNYGCEIQRPGIDAEELSRGIQPREVRRLASVTLKRLSDVMIDRLERRCYSTQWEIPEDIHRKVMAELKEKYGGRVLEMCFDILIYVWDARNLHGVSIPKDLH